MSDDETLTIAATPAAFHARDRHRDLARATTPRSKGSTSSKGIFCTQCEAEGFRRITYFLDRPDVLAVYTTRIEARQSGLSGAAVERQSDRQRRSRRRPAFRGVERSVPQALLSLRAGRGRSRRACRTVRARMSGRQVRSAHLCRARQRGQGRLCDGFAQARDALGRGEIWPRIRSRHLHDRGGQRLQFRRDGEQGPQHLQRQAAAGLAGDRDRRRLRAHRKRRGARVFPQLDRRPHHLPRLVPALAEGRPHRLPRPELLRRHALATASSASRT